MMLKTFLAFSVLAASLVLADANAAPREATQPVNEALSQPKTNPLAERLLAAAPDACTQRGGKCIDLKKNTCKTVLIARICPGQGTGCCMDKPAAPKK